MGFHISISKKTLASESIVIFQVGGWVGSLDPPVSPSGSAHVVTVVTGSIGSLTLCILMNSSIWFDTMSLG